MKSTGEVMGIDKDFSSAYAKACIAAGLKLPSEGNVFITMVDKFKDQIIPVAKQLKVPPSPNPRLEWLGHRGPLFRGKPGAAACGKADGALEICDMELVVGVKGRTAIQFSPMSLWLMRC